MSPSPGLRNRGQSLTDEVAHSGSTQNVADSRDRMIAHRKRHATGWEAAAETLTARADRVRVDFERGKNFGHFSDDVRRGRATAPVIDAAVLALPTAPPGYWLGQCLGCELGLWVHTQRPRVPLCERCRSKR